MTYWAIEYLVNPSGRRKSWYLDHRTIRRRRYEARQAPLEIDRSTDFFDAYNKRWQAETVRVVKVNIVRVE